MPLSRCSASAYSLLLEGFGSGSMLFQIVEKAVTDA